MKIIRKPTVNAALITLISVFYAVVFTVVSGHVEFERILDHATTLNSRFWNIWSTFLKQGQLKYVGYLYVVLIAAIVILTLRKRRDYDEYQCRMLEKGLIASGVVIVLLFPVALLLILSDPNYCVETITLLVVAHWLVCLVVDLVYVIQWSRS